MRVDPAQPPAHELAPVDQGEHFVVADERRLRQATQEEPNLGARTQGAAGQLADDPGMAGDFALFKQPMKRGVAEPEMVGGAGA